MKNGTFIAALFLVSMLSLASHTTHVQADAIPPPGGMVSWWPGDGNPNNIVNGNDGVLLGGGGFDGGMVDQAFSLDGGDDSIRITDDGVVELDGFSELTIDA